MDGDPSFAEFSVPSYDKKSHEETGLYLGKLSKYVTESDKMYGYRYEVDPIQQLMGTAMGWAGLPRQMAIYHMGSVPNPNGETSYQILMEDVPVGAFWSITGMLLLDLKFCLGQLFNLH